MSFLKFGKHAKKRIKMKVKLVQSLMLDRKGYKGKEFIKSLCYKYL